VKETVKNKFILKTEFFKKPPIYIPLLLPLFLSFFIITSCEKGENSLIPVNNREESLSSLAPPSVVSAANAVSNAISNTVSNPVPNPGAGMNNEVFFESYNEAILIRGNKWISGIPGFGDNSFSSLSGDYRLQDSSDGISSGSAGGSAVGSAGGNINEISGNISGGSIESREFSVYVTREQLYFSGEWRTGSAMGNAPVFNRNTPGRNFMATTLEDNGE